MEMTITVKFRRRRPLIEVSEYRYFLTVNVGKEKWDLLLSA